MSNEAWSVEAGNWGVKVSQADVQRLADRVLTAERERDDAIEAEKIALRVIGEENDRLRGLLGRLLEWDHLDGSADGPYWRREIEAALGRDKSNP